MSVTIAHDKRAVNDFIFYRHSLLSFKGISRGPEALQSDLNNFYHTSVLCWPLSSHNMLRGHGGVLHTTGISHSDP